MSDDEYHFERIAEELIDAALDVHRRILGHPGAFDLCPDPVCSRFTERTRGDVNWLLGYPR